MLVFLCTYLVRSSHGISDLPLLICCPVTCNCFVSSVVGGLAFAVETQQELKRLRESQEQMAARQEETMKRQEETMKKQEETMNAVLELRARQGLAADSRPSHSSLPCVAPLAVPPLTSAVSLLPLLSLLCCLAGVLR